MHTINEDFKATPHSWVADTVSYQRAQGLTASAEFLALNSFERLVFCNGYVNALVSCRIDPAIINGIAAHFRTYCN